MDFKRTNKFMEKSRELTVVYLGHTKFFFWKKLCRAHDILSRAHDIISRAHDLIIILVHFARHLHRCKQDQQ